MRNNKSMSMLYNIGLDVIKIYLGYKKVNRHACTLLLQTAIQNVCISNTPMYRHIQTSKLLYNDGIDM